MATHQSAIKRIRQTEKRRLLNKYFHKTTRNAIKKLQDMNECDFASWRGIHSTIWGNPRGHTKS